MKIALAGMSPETEFLLTFFNKMQDFNINVVYIPAASTPLIEKYCTKFNIPRVKSFNGLLKYEPQLIFLCSGTPVSPPPSKTKLGQIISYEATRMFCEIFSSLTQQLNDSEDKRLKYLSALNAAADGVQIINAQGVIEYINPAFSRITGIHASDRIGTNIRDVSPDGAGEQVLQTGRAALGVRNQAIGSCADVISNGAPIYRNTTLRGAVVTFQEVTDILRLSKELSMSKALIESLSQELDQSKPHKYTFNDLIGTNKKLLAAINLSKRAASSDSTILITGKSGTGKEILANAIHQASPRCNKPFISINCASIPDSLLESELFGHEKGAFTGADKPKIGKFQLADQGTLFLDEIGDLNFNVQAKLLRVLQEKEIERLGSNQRIPIDARIIAATNKDLEKMVRKGTFREDLFYRLQVIAINLSPLCERKDDIPALTNYLMAKIAKKFKKPVPLIPDDSLKLLINYSWPGNVRELENVLIRAFTLCDNNIITPKNLQFIYSAFPLQSSLPTEEITPLDEVEKVMITRALKKYGLTTSGKKAAAQALHISLSTLYNHIKLYNYDSP
ncbi:MAG: sigma 54-interacting transcriptional regulator [Veillonellales bacterium]